MRFLVLGGGLQGSACAFDLLGQDDVESVVIADLQPERPRAVSTAEHRLELLEVDFADEAQVRRAMEGRDVVLSAAPYAFNNDLARLAIESGWLLIGRDVIDKTGVLAPDEGIPYEPVVEELGTRGVRIAFGETVG